MKRMRLTIVDTLASVPRADWNAIAGGDNPFVRHEFLSALETTGCVGAHTGWLPQHLLLHDSAPGAGRLLGAVPLYLKTHSYGEYVFDWAWAQAYARAGLEYYPKLISAVPFSPVAGPRLLVVAHADDDEIRRTLIHGALDLARRHDCSSLHWLFTGEDDTRALETAGLMRRVGCQFHWTNPGYRDFDDFLSQFTSSKRNKIKRERRHVREAGITMEVLSGKQITALHWERLYKFYLATIDLHGAVPYLTREFFYALGDAMAGDIVLVFARQGDEYVAGAFNLRGRDTFYGRYWGGLKQLHSLHFETCYYAPIEYCIAHGLKRFEAGAQGEHKLARGFVPTATYSAHWLSHPKFNHAVADFLARERGGVTDYIDELNEHLPFKRRESTEQTDDDARYTGDRYT